MSQNVPSFLALLLSFAYLTCLRGPGSCYWHNHFTMPADSPPAIRQRNCSIALAGQGQKLLLMFQILIEGDPGCFTWYALASAVSSMSRSTSSIFTCKPSLCHLVQTPSGTFHAACWAYRAYQTLYKNNDKFVKLK